jgi:hypothetical protein
MSRLLILRVDPEHRLACSDCWKRRGDKDPGPWLFERYRDQQGESVSAAEVFELRREGEVVQWREGIQIEGRRPPDWRTFPGGTVFCSARECAPDRVGNFRVFDPQTGEEGPQ